MQEFDYVGSDRSGEQVSGSMAANTLSDAVQQLESSGINILSIQSKAKIETASVDNRHVFMNRIDAALDRSDSIQSMVDTMAKESPELLKSQAYHDLATLIRSKPSAEVVLTQPKYLYWLPLLLSNCSHEDVTPDYARYIQPFVDFERKRKRFQWIVMYPLFLLFIATVVVILISVFLIPEFKRMSDEMGWRSPGPIHFFYAISDVATSYPVVVAIGVVAVFSVLFGLILGASSIIEYLQSWRAIGLFTAGSSRNVSAMYRFTRTLGELLHVDAPLPVALRVAGVASESILFNKAATALSDDLQSSGIPLAKHKSSRSFPGTLILALEGDSHGRPNVSMIRSLAEIYFDRSQQRTVCLPSIVSPLSIVVIGILIGLIVLSLFSPFLKLLSGFN